MQNRNEFKLNPKVWENFHRLMTKHQNTVHKFDVNNTSYHVYIPLCLYQNPCTPEKLRAQIQACIEKGYNYTILSYPQDEKALKAWKEANADIIEGIAKDHYFNIADWRKNQVWIDASKKYDAYMKGDKKNVIQDKLAEDVQKYIKSHPDIKQEIENHNKQIERLKDDPDLNAEAITMHNLKISEQEKKVADHIINETKDVLSYLASKNEQSFEISGLFYEGNLFQLMYHAIQNAKAIGYDGTKSFLCHLKPDYEVVPLEEDKLEDNNAFSFDMEDPKTVAYGFGLFLLQQGINARIAGEAVGGCYEAFLQPAPRYRSRSQHNSPTQYESGYKSPSPEFKRSEHQQPQQPVNGSKWDKSTKMAALVSVQRERDQDRFLSAKPSQANPQRYQTEKISYPSKLTS